jgi:hypothetical protein
MSKASPPDLGRIFSLTRKPRISKISYKDLLLVSNAFRKLSVLEGWNHFR